MPGDLLGLTGFDEVVEVARGGFGVVYRAHQVDFDRTVAIKVLTGPFNDHARSRFERERRAMGSLSHHPNIVTVYGWGTTAKDEPYIVMEYMPGGALADVVKDATMPWPDVVHLGTKLARALHAAHLAGILHRDVKPENVLVSSYGEPMLADFRIAAQGRL